MNACIILNHADLALLNYKTTIMLHLVCWLTNTFNQNNSQPSHINK